MSKAEKVEVRKHALPAVVLYSLGVTFIIVGILLILELLGWYGSTLLTDGRWHTFTIVYAYWLTRRIIAIVISAGAFILIGTYMMHSQRITTWSAMEWNISLHAILSQTWCLEPIAKHNLFMMIWRTWHESCNGACLTKLSVNFC